MKNKLKRLFIVFLSVIFALSPTLLTGCSVGNYDGSGSNTGGDINSGDNSDNTTSDTIDDDFNLPEMNFNINDYLKAINLSWKTSNNEQSTDELLLAFASEVRSDAELIATDILVNLCGEYGRGISNDYTKIIDDYQLLFENDPLYLNGLSLQKDEDNKPLYVYTDNAISGIKQSDTIQGIYVSYFVNGWKLFTDNASQIWSELRDNVQTPNENAYCNRIIELVKQKFAYAILAISYYSSIATTNQTLDDIYLLATQTGSYAFEKLTDSNINQKYETLSKMVLHTGLVKNDDLTILSDEQILLYRFIKDYLIGQTAFNLGNHYKEKSGNNWIEKTADCFDFGDLHFYYDETFLPSGVGISYVDNGNGENVYICYDKNQYPSGEVTYSQRLIGENYDLYLEAFNLSLQINGTYTLDEIQTNLASFEQINNVKLYQQVADEEQMNISAKYKPCPNFKNYAYTIKNIILNTFNSSNVYSKQDVQAQTLENPANPVMIGHTAVANVYTNYARYSAIDINTELDAVYTNKLARRQYQSLILCANQDMQNNNYGVVYYILECAESDNTNISMYLRYYRTGVGYANWQDGVGEDKNLYKIGNQNVSGAFEFSMETGEDILELNLQHIIETAKFNGQANNNKFEYHYTDFDDQTLEEVNHDYVFAIEPFPVSQVDIQKGIYHSSVFSDNKYTSFSIQDGSNTVTLTGFDSQNLENRQDTDGTGYIEILFSSTNDTPFSIGFFAFMPQTEMN